MAVQSAGDLSQHAAVVRRDRQALGRWHVKLWRDDPTAGADLDQPIGELDADCRAQPLERDDGGAARLGAVAAARLGGAADLFCQERRFAN